MVRRIQLRRGTASQWVSTNPTLAQGEIGFELDTGKLKIGDGIHSWNYISYFIAETDIDALDIVNLINASGYTINDANISSTIARDSEVTSAINNHAHAGVYEPAFSKNNAFNKNFGTASNEVCAGNDSRLSDARTPVSHAHGNITNGGLIGTTANIPIITGTGGILQAGSFGTTANTFCSGDDSRITTSYTATTSITDNDLRSIPGNYYIINSYSAGSISAATAAITANYMVYVPLIIGNKDLHISGFSLYSSAGASGNFVVGIYANDDAYNATNGFCPSSRLAYSTAASTDATGMLDSACDYTFTKNKVYWIGWMSNATPTCYYKTQVYLMSLGQLPGTLTSSQTCWRHSQTYNATPPSTAGTLVAHDTAGFLFYKTYISA